MADLADDIKQFAAAYPKLREGAFHLAPETNLITHDIPEQLYELTGLDRDTYKIYGSVGHGNFAEIPWIGILERSVTTSTRYGTYIVLLFDRSCQNLYVSLSFGWVQFAAAYGQKQARTYVLNLREQYLSQAQSIPVSFKTTPLILDAMNSLGKGYEASSIIWKPFKISGLMPESLLDTIQQLQNISTETRFTPYPLEI